MKYLEESITEAEAVEAKARKYYKKFYKMGEYQKYNEDEFEHDAWDEYRGEPHEVLSDNQETIDELIEDEVALEVEIYERLKSKNLPLGIFLKDKFLTLRS
tara:strand:- start:1813 stop:2115 length:303 start_codon:yes stop_codon:yes gene_type:complete